jgi:hypothetical protein
MMTCEACGREFVARPRRRRARDCPYCGFNNGRDWRPRSPGVLDCHQGDEEKEKVPDEEPVDDED